MLVRGSGVSKYRDMIEIRSHECQELHPFVTNLLPPTRPVRLTKMTIETAYVLVQLRTRPQPWAICAAL